LAIIGRWLFQRHIAAPLRVIAGVGLLAVVYGQYTTISSRLSSKGALPTSVMAEAIGSDILPNNVGVMFNTAAEAQFRYFIRRPAWRSLYLPNPFPESVKACQRYLPTGWLLKYYVLFAPFDSDTRDTYQYMVRNCPGQIAAVDGFENPKRYMLLFDMSELHKPPDERKGLSAEVRDNQLRGVFAPWTIPDLPGRIQRAWHNQAGG